jgi:hypothetical protein
MKKLLLGFVALALSAIALHADEAIYGFIGANSIQRLPMTVFPAQNGPQMRTWQEPKQIFVDDFGAGTINTTSKWLAPTTGGGGNATAATNNVGFTQLGTGTTVGGFSLLQTQLVFPDRNPGYLFFQSNINLPAANTTGAYFLFGFFSTPTTPTVAAPCTNGVGFQYTTAGKLQAVSCASGTLTVLLDLSTAQGPTPIQSPTGIWSGGCGCVPQQPDTASYKYLIDNRGDNINFYVEAPDGNIRRVAYTSRGAAGPDVNQVPVSYLAIAGNPGPSASQTIQVNQTTIGDTAGNPIPTIAAVAGSAASGLVLKASPGQLISLYATCTAACFLMVFNATAVPADGATTAGNLSGNLQECIPITTANGVGSLNYAPGPYEAFSVGVAVSISSTGCATKTAATTGFIHGLVQ